MLLNMKDPPRPQFSLRTNVASLKEELGFQGLAFKNMTAGIQGVLVKIKAWFEMVKNQKSRENMVEMVVLNPIHINHLMNQPLHRVLTPKNPMVFYPSAFRPGTTSSLKPLRLGDEI